MGLPLLASFREAPKRGSQRKDSGATLPRLCRSSKAPNEAARQKHKLLVSYWTLASFLRHATKEQEARP